MLIFILFVSAGFLFDGAFSLWVSLTVALQFSNRSLLKRGLKRGLTPSLYGCYRHWASPITYVLIVTYLPWLQAYTLLKMKAWKSFFTKFWTKFGINSDINLYKNEYMMHKVYYFKSPSKNKILKLRKKALRLQKHFLSCAFVLVRGKSNFLLDRISTIIGKDNILQWIMTAFMSECFVLNALFQNGKLSTQIKRCLRKQIFSSFLIVSFQ